MFVFGYGSLTSRASLSRTLERAVGPDEFRVGHLAGWRREWNVALDDPDDDLTPVFDADGTPYPGVVVVLGIVVDERARCNGVIFPVSMADLDRLDARERNYDRVDVTTSVSFAGGPAGSVVFTYVPHAASVERLARAIAGNGPVAIRASYLETVRSGFAALGELEAYEASTVLPAIELRDLRFSPAPVTPSVPA